ncbi:MAG: hypothetical protein ACT4TC_03455 [Myxococcaceae bacterium]
MRKLFVDPPRQMRVNPGARLEQRGSLLGWVLFCVAGLSLVHALFAQAKMHLVGTQALIRTASPR